ncbi:MAG: GNAT family N-acetyltransferase [Desulfobacterales bacterium]|nr:GNAT family N-acetyltransferase [Desulfobacterales bacterium]
MTAIEIVEANLSQAFHQQAILELLDAYAKDPMGNGKPLSAQARRDLIPGLQQHPTTIIFLAFQLNEPVGIVTSFLGFSTFAARPLINISDFYVLAAMRGNKIGQQLLKAVENKARGLECCKITLEVQANNHRAKAIYAAMGFAQSVYVEAAGGALSLSKLL